ncbi:hypothetical protein INR49_006476 [Caranx melampygus]|nr:hypothetical protein INR49_006476 [Caranx melampygus]
MGKKQAIDSDYTGLKITTVVTLIPIYTMKNAKLNGGSWNKYETKLHNDTFKDCKTAYVVVGAVPSEDNWVIKNNQSRVNIPDYLWQAYCCVDNNDRPYKSGAAAAKNENTKVVECSLDSLRDFFAKVNLTVDSVLEVWTTGSGGVAVVVLKTGSRGAGGGAGPARVEVEEVELEVRTETF